MKDDIITVASYDNFFTAHLHKSKLDAARIACYLQDENSATITPYLSNAIGGIKLRVFSKDAERALQVLDEKDANDNAAEG